MSAVDHLRYDEVAFKASHNSIDRPFTIVEQLSGTGGLVEPCRALELDLVQRDGVFEWTVQHGVNDDGPPLPPILEEIAARSDANERHPVITIHLDLKNADLEHADFAEAIDGLLAGSFGRRRICGPGEVIGQREDLVRGARAGGWATFARLRGRFVFCLSGHGERKMRYARHEPRSRLCFADYPGSKGAPRRGHRVFANLFVDAAGYGENLARVKRHAGFVARGYNIVTRRTWDLSVAGGANVLSGDVLDHDDLSLGGEGVAPIGGR